MMDALAFWWLTFFFSWHCIDTLQWTSNIADRAVIQVCLNDSVTLPWNFTTDSGETIQSIEWYFQSPDEEAHLLAHTEDPDGRFVLDTPTPVQLVDKAGLLLSRVTTNDTGRYSIVVNSVDIKGTVTPNTQSAQVDIEVPPSTTNGQLQVQVVHRSMAQLIQGGTGEPQVQLSCGQFLSRGHPEADVVWTIPSGQEVSSTNYTNGFFLLTLHDPVMRGNYSCRLSLNFSAILCLMDASPLVEGMLLIGDDLTTRVAIAEARQDWLILENARLREQLMQESAILNNMTSQIEDLKSKLTEQSSLVSQVHNLQVEVFNQSVALQKLTSNVEAVRNCRDVQLVNKSSGVYDIQLPDGVFFSVYCDQTTDGGGWIVFQRRENGDVDFYRNWENYAMGFGNLNDEFWLGLDNLHVLTSQGPQMLRVDMEDWEDNHVYATYTNFAVGDSGDNYTLHIGDYKGNAGDSLSFHDKSPFSTWDHDHWFPYFEYCASKFHGAWWYNGCLQSNLNGDYKHNSSAPDSDGISWATHYGSLYSMRFTEMKFRPQ
ncbi:fibrinogen C domain-containing protein 1-A-like [Pomacea canaliculata]|uniref:fibrinogen C domain-containing protein 1-A-like n=1 Tax=Pomacea canaliculata TaxID=400727 RepID=UPI000D72DE41|nr:fibrinogen C domain-containing protein 1-A-like [Pomacea canaliculata]XP_025088821.1 fibrinogen C domain-containing protein 1-A-like [Pomacea canaliculata]XP_025088822.1 fibrinogen C domain-containing protein 1-A-like [Pomacea canaliculata]